MKETSILKNRWLIIAAAVLCWALLASFTAGYYWLQYTDFMNRIGGIPITVNVGINYGNSTGSANATLTLNTNSWMNNTKVLTGMTLFKVTEDLANITTYGATSGDEVFIQSLNNVSAAGNDGWVWWLWSGNDWTLGSISSGAYAVSQGETFMWYYESGVPWPPAAPPT